LLEEPSVIAAPSPRPAALVPARFALALLASLWAAASQSVPLFASKPPAEAAPTIPNAMAEGLGDLKAVQEQVKRVVAKVLPCTVNVRIGAGQGSGVIISADGYVLTAAHVSGPADRNVTIVFADGRKVKGKTLGANRKVDGGLIKITEEGKWPFAEMGSSGGLKRGQWCVAIGHPGGFKPGRPPVVRLGRVLENAKALIQTDCSLVGGDSGGPLFDLQGKVIGIHSRIGNSIAANIHVPVDSYRDEWDRLVKGEVWGSLFGSGKAARGAYLGVKGDPDAEACKIGEVIAGSPAAKAGLRADDVVTKFGDKRIGTFEDLVAQVRTRRPGDEVTLEIQRDDRTMTLRVVIGKRPDPDE
jgi:serine protease Do